MIAGMLLKQRRVGMLQKRLLSARDLMRGIAPGRLDVVTSNTMERRCPQVDRFNAQVCRRLANQLTSRGFP